MEENKNGNPEETLSFAGFISDYDPSLLFVMTFCEEKNISYLKVLKIEKLERQRGYSVYEDEEKKVMSDNLRNNLLA